MCPTCAAMTTQDALAIKTLEILEMNHDACAPVVRYVCRCRICETRWFAIEVFDEAEKRPSEWSWAQDSSPS